MSNGDCSKYKKCDPAVKTENAYYIGGFYGGASELVMMKELRSRGPIIADFEVPLSFSYYSTGIFSDDHDKML